MSDQVSFAPLVVNGRRQGMKVPDEVATMARPRGLGWGRTVPANGTVYCHKRECLVFSATYVQPCEGRRAMALFLEVLAKFLAKGPHFRTGLSRGANVLISKELAAARFFLRKSGFLQDSLVTASRSSRMHGPIPARSAS